MSGIFGICEPGVQLPNRDLMRMISAALLPGETIHICGTTENASLGTAQRWLFQQVGGFSGIRVAADADLWNLTELRQEIADERLAEELNVADVIARLYAIDGLDFVQRLQGGFAIALWDPGRQQLVLTIDRFGLKTLFWTMEGEQVLFGSRLDALACMKRNLAIDPLALAQFFLHSTVLAPLTIYKTIERIEPGMQVIYSLDGAKKRRYWDLEYSEADDRDINYWAGELREQIRASVGSHLRGCSADLTGAYLSGGTDSSTIVAFMSERCAPVNTFSIFFQNSEYSEIGFARTTASAFDTRHHERCLGGDDLHEAITRIFDYYDEPFANSSAVGAYFCAQLARTAGVGTLLAGDGGDELFAGNTRYATDRQFAYYSSIPQWMRKGIIAPACYLLPSSGALSLLARYVRRASIPNPRRFFSYSFLLTEAAQECFQVDFLQQVPSSVWLRTAEDHYRAAPNARTELNRLLYLDMKIAIADNDLRKVVGTAEISGVHVRFPFLDQRIAELSGRIPSELKLRGLQKRFIFKQAMKGILPDRVLYKKKHGFGVPVGTWLIQHPKTKALACDILSDPATAQRGYFRPDFLKNPFDLLALHPAYYGEVLWGILALELWFRRSQERAKSEGCDLQRGTMSLGAAK